MKLTEKLSLLFEQGVIKALTLTHTKPLLYPILLLLILLLAAFYDPSLFNKALATQEGA